MRTDPYFKVGDRVRHNETLHANYGFGTVVEPPADWACIGWLGANGPRVAVKFDGIYSRLAMGEDELDDVPVAAVPSFNVDAFVELSIALTHVVADGIRFYRSTIAFLEEMAAA